MSQLFGSELRALRDGEVGVDKRMVLRGAVVLVFIVAVAVARGGGGGSGGSGGSSGLRIDAASCNG